MCGKCGVVERALCGGRNGDCIAYERLLKWNEST